MALVNNVLVSVVVFVVLVRVESRRLREGSFSFNPDSVAQNEKILRLFIQLASETANHLIRLKREINVHHDHNLNCSKPAIGTKVLVSEKNGLNDLGTGLEVKMNSKNSTALNGISNTESSPDHPIEIASRLMLDGKENKTANGKENEAANATNVPASTVQLSAKAEKQLANVVNGTVGNVGQSGKVENGTEGMVPRTVVPNSSVSQAPIGQLSHIPTVQSSTSKPQSVLNDRGGEIGNRTLAPPTIVPSSGVGHVPNGRRPNMPTVQHSDSKTHSGVNHQTGKIGDGTAGTMHKPSVQSPRDNQFPLGQLTSDRTQQLGTTKNIPTSVPMNAGQPVNPNQVISSIPSIVNGTIGALLLLGRETGSKFLAQPNGAASSLSQVPSGQVHSNTKGPIDSGAQLTGAVPSYRSISSLMNPTTSVPPSGSTTSVPPSGPTTVPNNLESPADAKQMIASIEDINEKMGKMMLVDPENPGDPNDPKTMILQDPSVQAMGQMNYAKHQMIGEFIKGIKPMFRSFPEHENKSNENNKTVNATAESFGKTGTAVNKTQLGSTAPNAFHNKQLESELHNYVNKFLDALRPLDSDRTSASYGPTVE